MWGNRNCLLSLRVLIVMGWECILRTDSTSTIVSYGILCSYNTVVKVPCEDLRGHCLVLMAVASPMLTHGGGACIRSGVGTFTRLGAVLVLCSCSSLLLSTVASNGSMLDLGCGGNCPVTEKAIAYQHQHFGVLWYYPLVCLSLDGWERKELSRMTVSLRMWLVHRV